MTNRKMIAVTGATGAQGGGLAAAILNDHTAGFAVRAITRNARSPAAMALAQAGAEVVTANLDDLASLKQAFAGAYGAFCMTNYWEHCDPAREIAQADNLAEAAAAASLEHVIWSTLEDTRVQITLDDNRMPTLMGKYKVPHFDAKAEANACFSSRAVPSTFLVTSFYWDNMIHLGSGPMPDPQGRLAISLPLGTGKLPGIAAVDIGKCAYAIFKGGQRHIGTTVGIAGEHLTGAAMADALARALGREVVYHDVAPEVYRQLGFPGATDLGNMFQYKRDFNAEVCRLRPVAATRRLNAEQLDFAAWLARYKDQIPLEV